MPQSQAYPVSNVIVGFPGESYEHFLNLSYLHILTFSFREKYGSLSKV